MAVWSGVNMATQYPSAMSLDRLVNTNEPHPVSPVQFDDITLCDESCTKHSQAAHDAVRLVLYRVSVADRVLFPWKISPAADVRRVLSHHVAADTGPIMWQGTADDFLNLPMVPSKQNSDLLKICMLAMSTAPSSLAHSSNLCVGVT